MALIYIVEDDESIREVEELALLSAGHKVVGFGSAQEFYERLESVIPDLCIVDIMLPKESGSELVRRLRKMPETKKLPVIMVTAKTTELDLVKGIEDGADDYITKPFDLDELLVRIEVVLRRNGGVAPSKPAILTFKNLSVDTGSKAVTVNGNQLVLTAKEYGIIELLLSNPNKMFSKTNLFESVWHESYMGDDNLIKVHMSKVRTKIKEFDEDNEYIETVWGMGYRLKA